MQVMRPAIALDSSVLPMHAIPQIHTHIHTHDHMHPRYAHVRTQPIHTHARN